LTEDAFYEFKIAAANVVGIGHPSDPSEHFKCKAWTMPEPGKSVSFSWIKFTVNSFCNPSSALVKLFDVFSFICATLPKSHIKSCLWISTDDSRCSKKCMIFTYLAKYHFHLLSISEQKKSSAFSVCFYYHHLFSSGLQAPSHSLHQGNIQSS